MEEILKYENREQLYKFLIDDFGLIKIAEEYDPVNFGNFFIALDAGDFLLTYTNDRSFLTITITSKNDVAQSYDLSFVRDLMYNPENINADEPEGIDNVKRIEGLNSFLKRDFEKIKELFHPQNYSYTKKQIDYFLKEQFKKRHPGMV